MVSARAVKTMPANPTVMQLWWIVKDMLDYPREYGGWSGRNWDRPTLTEKICQQRWNTPCHPSLIPPAYRGLPFRTLRDLARNDWQAQRLAGDCTEAEAREWLASCACNRRCRGVDWKIWLAEYRRWQFRHLDDRAYDGLLRLQGVGA